MWAVCIAIVIIVSTSIPAAESRLTLQPARFKPVAGSNFPPVILQLIIILSRPDLLVFRL